MFSIALRNIFRQKSRSLIALSTIAFGCVALLFVGGFFDNTLWQMKESYIHAHTGHIQIYKRGFSKYASVKPFEYLLDNPEQIKGIISSLPQVKSVGSRLQFSGLITAGQSSIPCIIQGIELNFDRFVKESDYKSYRDFIDSEDARSSVEITSGDKLTAQDDPYQLALGEGLAQSLAVKPGANVTLLNMTVKGGNNAMDLNVKGVFGTASKDFDDMFLRVPLSTAQALLDTKAVQNIVVILHRTEDVDMVKSALTARFKAAGLDLEMKTWDELADFYLKTEGLFKRFHVVVGFVIVIAVILGIVNTMNMAVMERFSEIGTMMALGIKQRGILLLFLYEGLLLGFIGGTIGVLFGCIIVGMIGSIGINMPPPPGATSRWLSQPSIVWGEVIFIFILSMIIGGISSLAPAIKASRLKVVEALRYR